MKVLVIGASGHVGAYLTQELVKDGHEVHAVMRGAKQPCGCSSEIWDKVITHYASRSELYENDLIEKVSADVICDLIAYDLDGVKKIVNKITNDAFYIQIGSIWMYENKMYVPVDEEHPKNSEQDYGKQKGLIEDYLLGLAKEKKLRTCVVHPGHVSAKEWQPINPQGNVDLSVFEKIKNGEQLVLPFLGLNTLQHVHSFDLARIIIACMEKQEVSNGQAFIAVCEKAMTLRAICENLYRYYGKEPNLKYVDWEEFTKIVGEENAEDTLDHIGHSPCCTVEKAKKMLGVEIKYSIMDIFIEYLEYQSKK